MDATLFFLGFVFSITGLAYFVYGKKQANWIAMVAGAGLAIIPYLVPNLWILIAAGIVLMALPFVLRNYV